MRERPSSSELVAWTLVGLGLGLVAGFGLGGWLGPVDRRRSLRLLEPETEAGVAPLKASEAERAVERALAQDPDLRSLGLRAIAVGAGVVELHGWVPSRPLRARAVRLVALLDGIDSLVNCLLVHGEDDASQPALDATDQPA
jgi:hypothetical protein